MRFGAPGEKGTPSPNSGSTPRGGWVGRSPARARALAEWESRYASGPAIGTPPAPPLQLVKTDNGKGE